MKSIIEQIYYGNISEFDRKTVVQGDDELKAYEAIYNRLNAEEKALFDKFEEILSMNYGEELRATFERGFKMGARMAIEIAEFDIV